MKLKKLVLSIIKALEFLFIIVLLFLPYLLIYKLIVDISLIQQQQVLLYGYMDLIYTMLNGSI